MPIKNIVFWCFLAMAPGLSMAYTDEIAILFAGERPASEPYVSGDTFRKYCDHVIDIRNKDFDPANVKRGDIVFLSTIDYQKEEISFIDTFFRDYAPLINEPYILVTHNCDATISEQFLPYLESKNLFVWFAVNVGFNHPKLVPIPLGLENELWGRRYVSILNSIRSSKKSTEEKKYLLYMNFNVCTNRKKIHNYFKNKKFCHVTQRMSTEDYLQDIVQAKFVLSPHGHGLDCHRTWEALYLGVIPVVKTSSLDPLYKDLPVLIVNDWKEVTREFLENKYDKMIHRPYKLERLYMAYWLEVLLFYQMRCRG